MTVIGISVDDVESSRRLAARERIGFPLLSDLELTASRAYVGVDDHDLSVPGIVLVRPDGTIAYRRISGDKADRPSVAALLAEIDRAFGPPAETPALEGGYAPIERLQLGVALGGGARRAESDWDGVAVGHATVLAPLGRYVLAGGGAGGEVVGRRLDVDAAIAARLPFLDDLAAIQLVARTGYSLGDLDGWHAGGRLGLSFAMTPSWAFQLGAGATVLDLDATRAVEGTVTIEVTRLVRVR